MRSRGLAAIVAIVLARPAFTPVQANDPVTLDVIVTDAKSRPITNLRAADFELVDAGESRPVDNVRLHANGSRVVAIFLDEYHVQAGDSTLRARAALTHFVKTSLHDGDTVAIMKPLDPLNAITLTQDHEKILQAISAFEGRKGDYVARSAFEEQFISRDPKTAEVSRAQVVTSALQALATRVGDAGTGRRALLLLSEGFSPAMPRSIVYAANRNGVAIYPIDPHPEPAENEATLRLLAEQTGGDASLNAKDLAPAFVRAVSDLDWYYVLTFRPSAPADGKFHPVQVRVNRPGTQTRGRAGYWTVNAAAATAAVRSRVLATPFRPSHSSPFIRPWIGMSRGPDGLTSVTVTWESGDTPPRNQRVASIDVKATAADGRVLFQNRIAPGDRSRATFDAAPGYIALEMTIQSSTGAPLDTDYRALSVPSLQVTKPTFATPQVLRTRTARGFAELSANGEALPVASRTFSRAERLLVRIPVYGPGDATPAVTASLLNRRGIAMRELQRVPANLPPGVVQFDLPLSSLAPDEYRLELVASNAEGQRDEAREMMVFRVTH